MKVTILVMVGFLVLGVMALIFLALQFDPNSLRPQFQQHLGNILHAEVELASISVKWGWVPKFEINGIQILEPHSKEPLLRASKVRASVDLFSLFKRQLWVQSFELDSPKILVLRRQDKIWNWNLVAPVLDPKTVSSSGWSIRLGTVKASQARLEYEDETSSPHFSIRFQDLTLETLPVELPTPLLIRFEIPVGKALRANGSFQLDPSTHSLLLQMTAESHLSLEVRAQDLFESPRLHIKGSVQDVLAQDLAPLMGFQGSLSGHWEGTGEGLHPQEWIRSLRMKGDFRLVEGQFLKRNAVQKTLQQLAEIPVPGLEELPHLDYPPDFYEVIQGPSTPFKDWAGKLQASDGKIFMEEMLVQHPNDQMQLSGFINLMDSYIHLRGAIAFSQTVSEVMLSGAPLMEALQNPQNEILIPIEYRGSLPEADLFVDLDFIANRLVQMRGEQLASFGIQKLNEFLEAHRT